MRTWRVGTFSMGMSLLFLGVFLLLSQFLHWDSTMVLRVWWPALLVILGIEILIYLITSKQEKPYLNFDLFSIIIVGIVGTAGIAIVFLQSTGLMHLFEEEMTKEEITMDLPALDVSIKDNIKRIVIQTQGQNMPLNIEGTSEDFVSLFGTYRTVNSENKVILNKSKDYVLVKEKGDTVYLQMKELPKHSSGFSSSYATTNVTFLIPTSVKLEVEGNNETKVNPRHLQNDWSIINASSLELNLKDTNNVMVSVKDTEILDSENQQWKTADKKENDADGDSVEAESLTEAKYLKGKQNTKISIVNSGTLHITNN
ncbi:LiaI-LiaF-like domain-containing protein [Niallia nealsonii]|uniref:LiaI-LiaF-like transmembrane region domain-containing protein n=1 Tax=Niallia nealsonii TaxID=115979 RepID=A0A2N0Z6K3_9BACI|nr:DUF5668 domain-containing protein [Niallia nealsonii]PKG25130.1 hypothetical protein CWS01_03255 [Niallia nealsonii]